jgi:hypothetical protein
LEDKKMNFLNFWLTFEACFLAVSFHGLVAAIIARISRKGGK